MATKQKIYERHPTEYPGVYFINGTRIKTGKRRKGRIEPERIYLISYYNREGRRILEKAGRQFRDEMTPARASQIRARRINGDEPSNKERRLAIRAAKECKVEQCTFEVLWKEYKKQHPGAKRSATDETNFTLHLSPAFGKKEPAAVVPLDVDRLRISLSKKKAAGTVKNVLELLRRLSNFAEKKNLCPPLPFKVTLPRVNNIRTEDLTPEQMTRLFEVLRIGFVKGKDGKVTLLDEDAREMMLLALFTGMRRGEILRLRWEDVDFQRLFITIREPKGGTDQTIPLSEDARELLEKRSRRKGSDYVFPGRKKGDHRQDAAKSLRAIRAAAGLPKNFRPMHGLRHVFASTLASSGQVDLYTLQRLLTHKSPQMTMRYAHLRDETLKKAANLAGEIYSVYDQNETEGLIGQLDSNE